MLDIGDKPTDFTLLDTEGAPVRWDGFRGAPVVVFFYPKANTPGCTQEACAFRDLATEFSAEGVAVVGISADSVKVQAGFRSKHELGYPLLADPDHVVLEPWGVWGEKKMYGKVFHGVIRSTFLFDADGVVVHAWPKVRVKGHVDDVLAVVRARQAS